MRLRAPLWLVFIAFLLDFGSFFNRLLFLFACFICPDHARHQHARFDTDRLIHHALFLGIVFDLNVTGEREVLAERVSDEAIVGENAAQVRMPFEHDAVQVKRFTLVPVGAVPDIEH